VAAAGFPQIRPGGYTEPALVTSGDDLPMVRELITAEKTNYSAEDVINYLLTPVQKSSLAAVSG
jgi:hypothetical protein